MIRTDETHDALANTLCKSCGLCCTGHLFIWAKLRPSELDPAEALGMAVYRDDPSQRGFRQPCPLWQGHCTIYASAYYPRVCRAYQCKLLKETLLENISLAQAMDTITQAKQKIVDLDARLPLAPTSNFRERLVYYLEHPEEFKELDEMSPELRQRANDLLLLYEQVFGVEDLIERDDE